MPRLELNKTSLLRERIRLANFERYLPSLDLKRKQLMAERAKAAAQLAATRRELAEIDREVMAKLPMLANEEVALDSVPEEEPHKGRRLVQVVAAEERLESLVGVRVPRLGEVRVEVSRYALLGRPHWVDPLAHLLARFLEARLREEVERRRLEILAHAVQRITQRVNLFDKVLIPRTRDNIRRIVIYLADEERSAVVRSKIAKRKAAAEVAP